MNQKLLFDKMKEDPKKYEPVYKAFYEEPILMEPLRDIEDRLYEGERRGRKGTKGFGAAEDFYLGEIIYVSKIVDELDQDNNPFRECAEKAKQLIVQINDQSAVVRAKMLVRKLGGKIGVHEDILQACRLRMVEIAGQYDYRKGFRFTTFVDKALYQASLVAFNSTTHQVNRGLYGAREITSLKAAEEKLLAEGKEVTSLELAKALNCTVQKVESIKRNADVKVFELDKTAFLVPTREDFDTDLFQASVKEMLNLSMNKELNKLEREVLNIRYGIDGREFKSLVDAGIELEISREQVRLIEKTALQKLRHGDSSELLKAYLKEL